MGAGCMGQHGTPGFPSGCLTACPASCDTALAPLHTRPQLWQVVHPPKRRAPVSSIWGLRYVQRVVKVHSGFYEAWAGSGSPAAGSAPPTPAAHQQGQGQAAGAWDADEGGAEASNGTAEKRSGANATTSASGQQAEQGACWALLGWCGGGRQAQQVPVHVPFKKQLLERVDAMLKEAGLDPTAVTFYITGWLLVLPCLAGPREEESGGWELEGRDRMSKEQLVLFVMRDPYTPPAGRALCTPSSKSSSKQRLQHP